MMRKAEINRIITDSIFYLLSESVAISFLPPKRIWHWRDTKEMIRTAQQILCTHQQYSKDFHWNHWCRNTALPNSGNLFSDRWLEHVGQQLQPHNVQRKTNNFVLFQKKKTAAQMCEKRPIQLIPDVSSVTVKCF